MRCGTDILKDMAKYGVTVEVDDEGSWYTSRIWDSNITTKGMIGDNAYADMVVCIEEAIKIAKNLEQTT